MIFLRGPPPHPGGSLDSLNSSRRTNRRELCRFCAITGAWGHCRGWETFGGEAGGSFPNLSSCRWAVSGPSLLHLEMIDWNYKTYFSFKFQLWLWLCFRIMQDKITPDRGLDWRGTGDWMFKQLEWFLFFSLFLKKCTCLWYCLSSEMITPPLLYWYNIVHASVVFLYSSLKFINLYCRCYVFLWQKKIKSSNFLKFFFNLIFPFGGTSLLYQIVIVTNWSVLDVAIVTCSYIFCF